MAALLCLTYQVVNLWRLHGEQQEQIAALVKLVRVGDDTDRNLIRSNDIHARAISALQEQINELRDA